MRNLMKTCMGLVVLTLLLTLGSPVRADWVFVGSWDLATIDGGYDNPNNPFVWTANPPVYSGVTAAAMLFGGSSSEYAISTLGPNPSMINFLTFVDGWGDDQYLYNPTSENFSFVTGTGYNDPGGTDTAFSAYVVDHAPFDGPVGTFVNYAFIQTSVPEPSSLVLGLIGSLGGFGYYLRRRRLLATS